MQALGMHKVEKNYGKVNVLKDINLEIEPGQFLILVGPSGCGKSTLLNMIAGLESVSEGRISIGGNDVKTVCRVHPTASSVPGELMPLQFDLSKAVFFDPETQQRID